MYVNAWQWNVWDGGEGSFISDLKLFKITCSNLEFSFLGDNILIIQGMSFNQGGAFKLDDGCDLLSVTLTFVSVLQVLG